MTREKILKNYLYYKNILRCQGGASPLGLAGRVRNRARASPHLVSLCISKRHGRKKRQSGQGLTTRQDRAAEKLLQTYHYVAISFFSPPFPHHDTYCKKMMNSLRKHLHGFILENTKHLSHTFSRVSKPISIFASRQWNKIQHLLKCHP